MMPVLLPLSALSQSTDRSRSEKLRGHCVIVRTYVCACFLTRGRHIPRHAAIDSKLSRNLYAPVKGKVFPLFSCQKGAELPVAILYH